MRADAIKFWRVFVPSLLSVALETQHPAYFRYNHHRPN